MTLLRPRLDDSDLLAAGHWLAIGNASPTPG
jgi:hypothetical protein